MTPDIQPYPGQPLTVSLWVRASESSRTFRVEMIGCAADGTGWNGVAESQYITLAANQWTRLSVSVSSWPDNPNYRVLRIVNDPIGANNKSWQAGDTIDTTGLMVTQGATSYNYADGNSPGWSWTGTPNNSASFGGSSQMRV